MRNAMIGFFSIVILLLVGMTISSSAGKNMRQNELDSSLAAAMKTSMESLEEHAEELDVSEEQFVSDSIQASLTQTDAQATYEVTIYQLDTKKGVLDAGVTAHYAQVMHPGKVTVRRCIVIDDYKNDLDEYFTVVFQDGSEVVKQVQLYGGDQLTAQMLPQGNGYDDAIWDCNGTSCSRDQMPQIYVTGDMTFTKQ